MSTIKINNLPFTNTFKKIEFLYAFHCHIKRSWTHINRKRSFWKPYKPVVKRQ